MVNRDNYNIDYRLFIKEKLRSVTWLAWLIGGLVVCAIPALLDDRYLALSVGLAISWLCILFAVAGIVWSGASEKTLREFAAENNLVYNPRLADKSPDGRPVADSMLEARLAEVINFSHVKAVRFDDVLATASGSPLQMIVSRLSFEYSSRTEKQLYQYSLVMCTNMKESFPAFAIDGDQVYDFARFVNLKDIEKLSLEGSFGTDRSVYVLPEDRISMLSFFSPDVMELYAAYFGNASLVSKNGQLAILSRQNVFATDEYKHLYEGIEKLRAKLERYNRIHS